LNSAGARLLDGRTVVVGRFGKGDEEQLVEMYASLSDDAVHWGMPPYTSEVVEKWIDNLQNLIISVAFHRGEIVGHAQVFKFSHQRRKGTGDLIVYLHQDFHKVGLGTAMLIRLIELAKKEGLHGIGFEGYS